MTSPVSGANTQINGVHLAVQNSALSPQQKNIVRSMYLVSLGISLTGMGLLASSAEFSNSDLKNSHNMLISSLRFPCIVFGSSLFLCAEFVTKYFRQMNELEREGSPFFIQEIDRQLEEKIRSNLTLSEN